MTFGLDPIQPYITFPYDARPCAAGFIAITGIRK